MKKLMIVAVVAMAAMAANAQKITWGVTVGTTLDATKITTGTMYLVWSDAALDFSGVKAWSFGAATITGLGGTIVGGIATYTSGSLNAQTVVKPGDPVATMTQGLHKFYSVIIAIDGKTLAYTAATTLPIMDNETAASIAKAGSAYSYVSASAPEPIPMPEPTSAMLLLLGVAGLALRRKQK